MDTGTDKMLKHAQARPELTCLAGQLDADPWLLNVANGTLDLRTLELTPRDPADRITRVAAAPCMLNAARAVGRGSWRGCCPTTEVRGFLGRVMGMALLGEVREHVLPIWTGTGATARASSTGRLMHALGDYGATADPELLSSNRTAHPTGQMDLRGGASSWCVRTTGGASWPKPP